MHLAAVAPNPDERLVLQIARILSDSLDGVLRGTRYLLLDRDSKFSAHFRSTTATAGTEVIRTAVGAPNLNAIAERFVRSIKAKCLHSLRRAVDQFTAHDHAERAHQDIGNVMIQPKAPGPMVVGPPRRKSRLGGLLSYDHRSAA